MSPSHANLRASVSTCANVRALTVEVIRKSNARAAELRQGGAWVKNNKSCASAAICIHHDGTRAWQTRAILARSRSLRACALEWEALPRGNLSPRR